jgi:hypothetical protein
VLELTKGFAGLKSLCDGLDRIVTASVGNEIISAPVAALGIHVPVATVPRRNEREHTTTAIRLTCYLRGKMRGHALNVLHEGNRVLEDIDIDALQNMRVDLPACWKTAQYVSLMWPLPAGLALRNSPEIWNWRATAPTFCTSLMTTIFQDRFHR